MCKILPYSLAGYDQLNIAKILGNLEYEFGCLRGARGTICSYSIRTIQYATSIVAMYCK